MNKVLSKDEQINFGMYKHQRTTLRQLVNDNPSYILWMNRNGFTIPESILTAARKVYKKRQQVDPYDGHRIGWNYNLPWDELNAL